MVDVVRDQTGTEALQEEYNASVDVDLQYDLHSLTFGLLIAIFCSKYPTDELDSFYRGIVMAVQREAIRQFIPALKEIVEWMERLDDSSEDDEHALILTDNEAKACRVFLDLGFKETLGDDWEEKLRDGQLLAGGCPVDVVPSAQ